MEGNGIETNGMKKMEWNGRQANGMELKGKECWRKLNRGNREMPVESLSSMPDNWIKGRRDEKVGTMVRSEIYGELSLQWQ